MDFDVSLWLCFAIIRFEGLERTWYSNTKQLQVAGIKMDTGVVKLTGTLDEGEQLKVWTSCQSSMDFDVFLWSCFTIIRFEKVLMLILPRRRKFCFIVPRLVEMLEWTNTLVKKALLLRCPTIFFIFFCFYVYQ
ncbi:hypothetical protein ACQ4LE_000180 [Meloidogyne hapla]